MIKHMEKTMNYQFGDGSVLKITLGEDGYTVNVVDISNPLMGTFTSFENLLYGIAPIVQNAVSDGIEFGMFTSSLYFNFAEVDDDVKKLQYEIGNILMK